MTAAYPQSFEQSADWGVQPILVVGDGERALRRAERTVLDAGLLPAPGLNLGKALERLDSGAHPSAVWVEVEDDGGAALDGLLKRIDQDVHEQRYSAVVAAPAEMIDRVSALVSCSAVELVIGSSEVERAAALAVANANMADSGVREASSESSNARLRQLSEEVNRIATALAKLSSGPQQGAGTVPPPVLLPIGEGPHVPAEVVRSVIRARRVRANYFPADLFADPAWDMLLDLLQAEIAQHRVPVSSLCIAAAVPATTALRWIKTMTDKGLLKRRNDPHDGRRVFMEMTAETSTALRRYFVEVGVPVGA